MVMPELRPDQKLVAMTDELFQILIARGPNERAEVHWGEPSPEGIYTPAVYLITEPPEDAVTDPIEPQDEPVEVPDDDAGDDVEPEDE